MGLLLSVLVFSVGVIEALSCYDRFKTGYLPLSYQKGRQHSQTISDILSKLEQNLAIPGSSYSCSDKLEDDNDDTINLASKSDETTSLTGENESLFANEDSGDDNDSVTSEDTVIMAVQNDTADDVSDVGSVKEKVFKVADSVSATNNDKTIKFHEQSSNCMSNDLKESYIFSRLDTNVLSGSNMFKCKPYSENSIEDAINFAENVHIQRNHSKLQRSVSEPSFQDNVITGRLQIHANSKSVDDGLNTSITGKRNKSPGKKKVRFNLDTVQIHFVKETKVGSNSPDIKVKNTSENVEVKQRFSCNEVSTTLSRNQSASNDIQHQPTSSELNEANNFKLSDKVDSSGDLHYKTESLDLEHENNLPLEQNDNSSKINHIALSSESLVVQHPTTKNDGAVDNVFSAKESKLVDNALRINISCDTKEREAENELLNGRSTNDVCNDIVGPRTIDNDSSIDKNENKLSAKDHEGTLCENKTLNFDKDKLLGGPSTERRSFVENNYIETNIRLDGNGDGSNDSGANKNEDVVSNDDIFSITTEKGQNRDKIDTKGNETLSVPEEVFQSPVKKFEECKSVKSTKESIIMTDKKISKSLSITSEKKKLEISNDESEEETSKKEPSKITRRRAVKSKLVYDRSVSKGSSQTPPPTIPSRSRQRKRYKEGSGTESEEDWGIEEVSDGIETDNEKAKAENSISDVTKIQKQSDANSGAEKAFWLIFSGEYTKAMSKDWHSSHFCCWQCDESLTGQRYVLREEHPYCIKCYESVFANSCEECSRVIGIDSKDLSYKDKHWHEACFLCSKCRVSLVDKQFGSKADKIYCGNCYDAQFASRCDGCGQIFRAGTKKMEYKTRQWHEQCFCCCVCKNAIGTKSFIPREQEIYCATCYEEKFATRCVKCNKIITSGGVTYKNEPWHRECFTCTNCGTSLAGQRFTSREDKPYCADCFGELFAKRCTACTKPITGIGGTRFISFEDRHWHNDCFICAACKTSLVGRGFITDGEDIICPECAKQKLM